MVTAKRVALLAVLAGGVSFAAYAQEAEEAPAEEAAEAEESEPEQESAWIVYVEEDPLQCWVVSEPTAQANTRDGEAVNVDRDPAYIFISFWPELDRAGEVSFTGGYPFAEDSVSIEIGGANFEFFSEGEMAWALSEEQDAQIIDALRAGSEAFMNAQSTRGTDTRDTFSLAGFSAAMDDAEARCTDG